MLQHVKQSVIWIWSWSQLRVATALSQVISSSQRIVVEQTLYSLIMSIEFAWFFYIINVWIAHVNRESFSFNQILLQNPHLLKKFPTFTVFRDLASKVYTFGRNRNKSANRMLRIINNNNNTNNNNYNNIDQRIQRSPLAALYVELQMRAFLMGLESEIGENSAIFRSFLQNELYERQVLRIIKDYL